ncbi:MAG: hypothetical protein NC417_00935 [Candidatus Gastranaerophilales bacterium]|nr:hypothetical protein [Candidatus Gastranaerophilales bacterium]
MDRLKAWWKKDKRYMLLCKAVLIALLPVLCCLVSCAVQGQKISEAYLPNSEWNDELFYYKQVEGIVEYGYPQGYFGFNESHAQKLSFAAWSPVLVFPWILWGLIFGWNLLSPIICNIVLLTAACFLFVWMARPTWRQTGVLALLFCLYTSFVRYMLSGMPEIICFSLLIIFYGMAVSYLREEKGWKLAVLFGLSGLLTLMRPYMLLFMIFPAFLWFRRGRWKGAAGSALLIGATLVVYVLIKRYLGAEYFTPLFYTDWITTFVREGIGAGIHNFFGTLYWKGTDLISHIREGFRSGLASGAFFGGFLVMMAVLVWQTVSDWRRLGKMEMADGKAKELRAKMWIEGHLALSFVGMLFALLLMYKLTEGSKHLLTFMAAGIFVVSLMETKTYKKAVLLGAVFAYLYSYKAVNPYDYQVPYVTEERCMQVEEWRAVFEETIKLSREDVPNFDNVVIWMFYDKVGEETVITDWQILYALPAGMGISCCEQEYVAENLDTLQSRYLAIPAGGELDEMCLERGYTELGRDSVSVVYRREL